MEYENKYKPTYKTPAQLIREHNIGRQDWLKHYYSRDEVYEKIMPLMDIVIEDMELAALSNKFNAPAIFNMLEYWFPDIFQKVKISKSNDNKQNVEILKTTLNKSGFSMDSNG